MNKRKVLAAVVSPIVATLIYTLVLSQESLMQSLQEHTWHILLPTFIAVAIATFIFELLVIMPVSSFLAARGAGAVYIAIVSIACWFAITFCMASILGLKLSAAFSFAANMLVLGVPLVALFLGLTVHRHERA
jgi:hypothetical protein